MIEKSGTGGTTVFMQDESGHLLGEYNGSGSLIEETLWLGDIPVATLQPNGSGGVNVYYVHTDHLNTPRKVAQPTTGTLAWRWDTDPFATAAPNQNPAGLGTFSYNLRLPGQYFQAETGLNYNYHRDYDPLGGRYIESDPVGLAGLSWSTYSYADDAPTRFIDPYGLQSDTAAILEAIAEGNVEALQSLLDVAGNENEANLIRAAIQRWTSTADQLISRECQARIRQRFPKSVLNNTLKEIKELAQEGDGDAQTAWKLLNDLRFKK